METTEKCRNEEKLIKSAKSGNGDAFGELVRHYERFVFNVAYSFVSDTEDALDVSQDAFIKAWRGLGSFQGKSSFSTWLYRITANAAHDALALKKRDGVTADIDTEVVKSEETPEDSYVKDESARELRRALSLLDEEAREILILREFEELSYLEIAEVLSIELGTVKSRINRARIKLREILSKNMEQTDENKVKKSEKEGVI